MNAVISADGLTKVFRVQRRTITAVEDVSLAVKAGEARTGIPV